MLLFLQAQGQPAQANQNATGTGVKVEPLGNRILITMPSSDGTSRFLELSSDGKSLLSIEGIATTAIPPAPAVRRRDGPSPAVEIMQAIAAMVAFIAVGGPLARAYARRIEKRTLDTPAALPVELSQRLTSIEQSVDAVAVEVERISEGQRFTTKLLSDRTKVEVERM